MEDDVAIRVESRINPEPMAGKESSVSLFEWCALALVLGLIAGLKLVADESTKLRLSTHESQPLVVVAEQALNASVAAALEACASAQSSRNVLGKLFVHSRSAAAGFNRDGIDSFCASRLGCLLPYFDEVRDHEANAWVLNVLACQAGDADPVQWHIDQTIALRLPLANFAAHSVDVWYAALPDMVGGELELAQFSEAWLDKHAMRTFGPNTKRAKSLEAAGWEAEAATDGLARRLDDGRSAAPLARALITPQANTRVTFRGDAHHRVRPFHPNATTCTGDRVSVVLEQYRVPQDFYWLTTRFHMQI